MNVMTRPCVVCGNRSTLQDVNALGYIRWKELGQEIQDALPDLDADQRELLISGTHAHCWEKMWGPDDAA
jgi:hypothetical protein